MSWRYRSSLGLMRSEQCRAYVADEQSGLVPEGYVIPSTG